MIKAETLIKPVVYSVNVPSSLDAPLNNTILRDSTKFEEEIKCVGLWVNSPFIMTWSPVLTFIYLLTNPMWTCQSVSTEQRPAHPCCCSTKLSVVRLMSDILTMLWEGMAPWVIGRYNEQIQSLSAKHGRNTRKTDMHRQIQLKLHVFWIWLTKMWMFSDVWTVVVYGFTTDLYYLQIEEQ